LKAGKRALHLTTDSSAWRKGNLRARFRHKKVDRCECISEGVVIEHDYFECNDSSTPYSACGKDLEIGSLAFERQKLVGSFAIYNEPLVACSLLSLFFHLLKSDSNAAGSCAPEISHVF